MLGVSTGGRISELLSLTIGDVYQNSKAVTDLLFDKSVVKGGEVSRAVPVNKDGRRAIEDHIKAVCDSAYTKGYKMVFDFIESKRKSITLLQKSVRSSSRTPSLNAFLWKDFVCS